MNRWNPPPGRLETPAARPLALQNGHAPSSTASYVLFLLVNATAFLRPAEMLPSLASLPIYELLIASCTFCSLGSLRTRLRWRTLRQEPIPLCVLGLLAAVVLSDVSRSQLSGAVDSGILFFKTALYFLLLVSVIDTPRRFQGLVRNTCLCSCLMIALCVADYTGVIDLEHLQHYNDRDGETETGSQAFLLRMRGTGFFEDPNDISLLIVGSAVLCVYFLNDLRRGLLRFLWCGPLAVLAAGLFCTHSRGGLLAAGAAGMAFVFFRFGGRRAALLGAVGLMFLPLVAGRQGNIDLEEGTGQQRIQLWNDGLTELKSPSILFGIGRGTYQDLTGYVAHNSFVHAYVELGYFGGTLFFGCFFFAALALLRMHRPRISFRHPELQRFLPYLAALLAGWATGLFSLSRCYVVPTYMILGLAASYIRLAGVEIVPRRAWAVWDGPNFRRLLASSTAFLVFLFIFARTFARFG